MGTEATTDRARFLFKVAEYGGPDYTPWIMTEPHSDRLKVLGTDGFIGFDLKPGTTFDQAREIAQYLNQHIECITCTLFR